MKIPHLAALLPLSVLAAAPEPGVFTQDYDAALAAAAERGLPVLLDFTGSDWCHWCMVADEKVFSTDEWKAWAATNVVPVTVDFPNDESLVPEQWRGRNEELAEKFGVDGFPTFVLVSSDAKEIGRFGLDPSETPESFEGKIAAALVEGDPARLEKVLGKEDAAEFASLAVRRAEIEANVEKLQDAVEKTAEKWREKLSAAAGGAADAAAKLRRTATREIAAAMSAAQKAESDAQEELRKIAARLAELREKIGGGAK